MENITEGRIWLHLNTISFLLLCTYSMFTWGDTTNANMNLNSFQVLAVATNFVSSASAISSDASFSISRSFAFSGLSCALLDDWNGPDDNLATY